MIASLDPPALQALADTVVTVQARGTMDVVADVALVALAVSMAATFVLLAAFLRRLADLERSIRSAGRRAAERTGPLVERARDIADNVEFVTRALRTDVERLNASVKALSDRLGQASDRMEERIEEFNALMEVVQSEAESIFIDTASTVRGVRAGARSLGAGELPDAGEAVGAAGTVEDAAVEDTAVEDAAPGGTGVYLTGGPDEADEDTERLKEA